jgi:hypothetical protein
MVTQRFLLSSAFALFAAFGAPAAASPADGPPADSRIAVVPDTNTHFTFHEYKTLADWQVRSRRLRRQVLMAAGLLPMPEKRPVHAEIFGRVAHKDFTVEKVLLETMPGYWLGGNLFRPVGKEGKRPAVLSPHGHWGYGRLENQQMCSVPLRAINLARQGYVVFIYDMVGYNDTIQTPHGFGGKREQLWAFGPLGLQTLNSVRALDFIESLDQVDPKRIGVTGASGGGTQTFILTAVDDRVAFSAPVNMISAIMQGGSECENAPGLRIDTFNVELGALMAPRPMLMISATGDWTKNNLKEEYPAIRSIYALYGKSENLRAVQFDADHNYNKDSREAMYRFFAKQAYGDEESKEFAEKSSPIDPLEKMLALHNRKLPEGALTYEQIVAQWIAEAKRQNAAATDPIDVRERLSLALACEWPKEVASTADGQKLILSRKDRGDQVLGWRNGTAPVDTIVVNADGAAAAATSFAAKREGALRLAVFQTGEAATPAKERPHFYHTFNRSDDANRVQDILTALAWVNASGVKQPSLVCTSRAAVWCTFAAAVSPVPVKLEAPLGDFKGTDAQMEQQFFVPGIQRAGGLDAALRLLGRSGN